jgi:two-component system sensor histidine kinase FlrB
MAPLCRGKGVAFGVSAEVGAAMITGSRKALGGALLNLLENALQACEARSERGAEVALSAAVVDRQLRISVRDTGEGIAPEAQERIFEPFFTTRSQGTGLGLAIALGVARAHGGSIKLSSRPGDGSEFMLFLPAGLTDEEEGY